MRLLVRIESSANGPEQEKLKIQRVLLSQLEKEAYRVVRQISVAKVTVIPANDRKNGQRKSEIEMSRHLH